jgi:hypothetical protein
MMERPVFPALNERWTRLTSDGPLIVNAVDWVLVAMIRASGPLVVLPAHGNWSHSGAIQSRR